MEFYVLHIAAVQCTQALSLGLKKLGVDFFAVTAVDQHGKIFAVGSDLAYGEAYIRQKYYTHRSSRCEP